MKTKFKILLVAGYNHGIVGMRFVDWCFIKFRLGSL